MGTLLNGNNLGKLLELVALLRSPSGCPWDREQNYDSMKGLLLEETYEVIDSVSARDFEGLEDELGDLLYQVVFFCRLAEEEGRFDMGSVIEHVHAKLVRRHPHVFGTVEARNAEEALASWLAVKEQERASGKPTAQTSLLDGFSPSMPSTLEAFELGVRAAEVGFDWPNAGAVLDKVEEEVRELRQELAAPPDSHAERLPQSETLRSTPSAEEGNWSSGLAEPRSAKTTPHPLTPSPSPLSPGERGDGEGSGVRDPDGDFRRREEEVGDLLFAVASLARKLHTDPESCLRRANQKFGRRFRAMEEEFAKRGKKLQDCPLEEMEAVWTQIKFRERP